jgi:hypothetical protein
MRFESRDRRPCWHGRAARLANSCSLRRSRLDGMAEQPLANRKDHAVPTEMVERIVPTRSRPPCGLEPHLLRTYKVNEEPAFAKRVKDIVGLYLSPPDNAMCRVSTRRRRSLRATTPSSIATTSSPARRAPITLHRVQRVARRRAPAGQHRLYDHRAPQVVLHARRHARARVVKRSCVAPASVCCRSRKN